MPAKAPQHHDKKSDKARTDEKSQVENLCPEDLWTTGLRSKGWSTESISRFLSI